MFRTSPRLWFILNGKSGSCDPVKVSEAIERIVADHGAEAHIHHLQQDNDIAALVRTALRNGATAVVGGGGDGTISAIASELVGSNVPLGILPLGTLNHFAKTLNLPVTLEEAITNVITGETRDVDVGHVNGSVFLNNSGIGLYPRIVLDREASQKQGRAKWFALIQATLRKLKNYTLIQVALKPDGGQQVVRATPFLFVGNNKYETSGLEIGSRTSLDAGRLWVALAPEAGRLKLLALAARALTGRLKERHLEVFEAADLEVTTRRKRLEVAMDGEVKVLKSPLRYRSLPKTLRVIVPSDLSER